MQIPYLGILLEQNSCNSVCARLKYNVLFQRRDVCPNAPALSVDIPKKK